MKDYRLDSREIAELRAAHRRVRELREAYRINAVILLGQGRTAADVADAVLLDPDTPRSYFKRYKDGGGEELLHMSYVGSETLLNPAQLAELDAYRRSHLHFTAAAVARWVEQRWRCALHPQRHDRGAPPPWTTPTRRPSSRLASLIPRFRKRSWSTTKQSRKTRRKAIRSTSWTPRTRSTTRSSAAAGSSAGRTTRSRATRAGSGSTSTAPSRSRPTPPRSVSMSPSMPPRPSPCSSRSRRRTHRPGASS